MKKLLATLVGGLFLIGMAGTSMAFTLFSDDFSSGANSVWGNEVGNWAESGGVYSALSPTNAPLTYSSVTTLTSLTDFSIDVDINSVSDGGVWLRSQDNNNGILLVTGGYGNTYNGIYWHIVTNGSYTPPLNQTYIQNFQGSNVHLTVDVNENTYKAYINGVLQSTLIDSTYSSGKFALNDYSGQTFDNIVITGSTPVPEPSTIMLFAASLLVVAIFTRFRSQS